MSAPSPGTVDFTAALLKGVVEHGDPAAYFGSRSAMRHWGSAALKAGWLTEEGKPTLLGRRHYTESGLSQLPQERGARAYDWDWTGYRRES